jgi:ABC-type cobalamin/Fe3+-siderophores transport system ATPase subunit
MLLHVADVGWRAGDVCILRGVSFAVAAGEFVALMGPNGAGKSTLLDLVGGLRKPSKGVIAYDGRPLDAWSPRDLARTISHLPQMLRTDVGFSAEQLVFMGRYPHSAGWSESTADRQAAEHAMQRCGCIEFRHRCLSTLSGGERQRVFLAACLAQEPRLLLLDEPATFLDIEQQLQCFSMLRAETGRGAACMVVTHDINLALAFCTRLLVLAEKRLAADLPVEAAIENPEWLQWFSPRIEIARTPTGRPWVYYA